MITPLSPRYRKKCHVKARRPHFCTDEPYIFYHNYIVSLPYILLFIFTPFRVYIIRIILYYTLSVSFFYSILFSYPKGCIVINMSTIGNYIKEKRKEIGLTQEEFAMRSGLGLRFVRELEQGKETVRLDKVNQALSMFGKEAVPGDRKES